MAEALLTIQPFFPPMPPSSTIKTSARSVQVLYADDLPELRELMRLVLGRDGHVLESCADGAQALARLEREPDRFDLLITDHHMPVMNGLELVRRVRQTPFAGRIVVFSSELAPGVQEDYLAQQVDHVLAKPVLPRELRQLLAEMFPVAPAIGQAPEDL